MEQRVQLIEKEFKVTFRNFQQRMSLEFMHIHYFQNLKRLFKALGYELCFFETSEKFLSSQPSMCLVTFSVAAP